MLLDFVLHLPYDQIPHLPGVIRHLRFKLAGVLVNASDGRRVELQLEVVGEELHFLTYLARPLRSLREYLKLFHLLYKIIQKYNYNSLNRLAYKG